MITVDDLNNYKICPNIIKYPDRSVYYRWLTFKQDRIQFQHDFNKFVALLTYDILCRILVYCKDEMIAPRPERSLRFYEEVFNEAIWAFFPLEPKFVKEAATAWVRLFGIYRKIMDLSKDYSHLAENISFKTRVFRDNPISVEAEIPIIFADTKAKKCDLLYIVPNYDRNDSTTLMNLYHMLSMKYVSEVGLSVSRIHIISFDEENISKNFSYESKYNLDNNLHTKYLDRLENNQYPNIYLCPNCVYRTSCNKSQILNKVKLC